MANHEQQPLPDSRPEIEILDPRHFYAAYIFDRAIEHKEDIEAILEQAKELGYPVRYWRLSDAMDLQGFPDRLIICVHHPSSSEETGMGLYEALKAKEVTWDDLEAAVVDEYRDLGKPVEVQGDLLLPDGSRLFPKTVPDDEGLPYSVEALFVITRHDVREELQEQLGREVTDEELSEVLTYFKKALDYLDWTFYLNEAMQLSVEAKQKRSEEQLNEDFQKENSSKDSQPGDNTSSSV